MILVKCQTPWWRDFHHIQYSTVQYLHPEQDLHSLAIQFLLNLLWFLRLLIMRSVTLTSIPRVRSERYRKVYYVCISWWWFWWGLSLRSPSRTVDDRGILPTDTCCVTTAVFVQTNNPTNKLLLLRKSWRKRDTDVSEREGGKAKRHEHRWDKKRKKEKTNKETNNTSAKEEGVRKKWDSELEKKWTEIMCHGAPQTDEGLRYRDGDREGMA